MENFVSYELVTGDIIAFKVFRRIMPENFIELLAWMEPHVQRSDSIMRVNITPHAQDARRNFEMLRNRWGFSSAMQMVDLFIS